MSFHPDPADFADPSKLLLANERSDWLDSFSHLEVAAMKCGDKFLAKSVPRGSPLKQRLKALAAVSPSPSCAKVTVKELRGLAQECERLLPLRATIVHSAMLTGRLGDIDIALFRNGAHAANEEYLYLVMTRDDFRQSRAMLDRLTKLLETLARVSSRPRPEPVSAACP